MKKFTKLSTLVKLYNLKVRHGWSNISSSELLKALKDILPSPNDLPTSIYAAKKMLGALGMEYERFMRALMIVARIERNMPTQLSALNVVGMELATGDVEVSNNLRWISHGPHPVVTTYNSYAINGCHYHTKSHDKNKTVQNSRVSLVAKTMQVAIFKCDWVENSGGIKTDELGHFKDQYNDDELGDTVLNCQRMPKATLDIESRLELDENTPTYIDSYTMKLPTDGDLTLGLDEVEIGYASKNEKKKNKRTNIDA
ncbi:uncharacterized protein E5676_scaffold828G00180 [Cucumis melo var. makuwa]|uniref:Uncharacterized protein n=1 Tax=Cucumis melo var. makuwa TaxID=1194695 RepID=A0A5A7V828_CUCMM|nr:uncharacterized protein E6C27_scaffold508G00190 [Cucumis melo var. makuwa]TYK11652.1 uncharacterized protein E5676_scaffold828G00180 [Cucumis melo var. makuwa]